MNIGGYFLAAVAVAAIVALNIVDYMAQRRRRLRWLTERLCDAERVHREHNAAEDSHDIVKEIVAEELRLPARLLRDEDTIGELCDLGMEITDLRLAIKRRFGLHLRDRDFFHGNPWLETVDDDYSLTLGALRRLIETQV